MKVYLAGPSSEINHVRAVASELEEAGHEIVDRWWLRVVPGTFDDRLPDDVLDASIVQCVEALNQKAEVLVALSRTTLNCTLSTGTAVEVGMALANGWPVIVLRKPERFPFRTRCIIAGSVAQVLAELRAIEHARWVEASDMAGYRAGDAEPEPAAFLRFKVGDRVRWKGSTGNGDALGLVVARPGTAHVPVQWDDDVPREHLVSSEHLEVVAPRERADQLVAAPPSPSGLSPALVGGSDVTVEEPPPSPGRRPDASEAWRERWSQERVRVEILGAMVQRAAREIRSERFRSDLLADLEAVLSKT